MTCLFLENLYISVKYIVEEVLLCHNNCAACCSVISISSPLPSMPFGKPAGIRCVNLDDENLCKIYEATNYPIVCKNFKMNYETCGKSAEQAIYNLGMLERLTSSEIKVNKFINI